MTFLPPTRSARPVPRHAFEHGAHWQRLQDERRFRLEQLAALEAETPATPRHASVTRILHASAAVALSEVDAALARIAERRYGLCVSCEGRIDEERLAVLPMTSLCMRCHYNQQNCQLAAMADIGLG